MRKLTVRLVGHVGLGLFIFTMAVLGQEKINLPEAGSQQGQNSFVGVWEAVVTMRNCQTGEPLGPPFQSLVTNHEGGTISEYGANPAMPFRSPGHGVWQRGWAGDDSYHMRAVFFPMTPAGIPIGKIKITQTVHYNRYTDRTESSGGFELTSPAGVVIATGCSTATATRFQ